MAGRTLDFGIIVRLSDAFSAPMRAMTRGIEVLNRTAKNTDGLAKFANQLDDIGRRARNIGLVTGGAGAGLSAALGLHRLPSDAIESEHNLRAMGNVANLTAGEIGLAKRELRDLSVSVNQTTKDLDGGLSVLTSRGLAFQSSLKLLPSIGRTATAMGADIGDLSKTAFAMSDNLKVASSEMQQAMEVAAMSGQQGAFELRDMARFFPVLTAAAQNLGQVGVPAVSRLGASLQIAFKGAGDPGVAATNLENYLKALTMPITQGNFKEKGVDLGNILRDIIARHGDVVEETVSLVQQLTGGDPIRISELFRDAEAQNFLKPMLANLGEYRRMRDESLSSKGLIDRNFTNMMTTTAEQMKQTQIRAAAIASGPFAPFLNLWRGTLQAINSRPWLATTLVGLAGFLTLAGGGITILGGFAQAVAWGLAGFAKYPVLLRSMSSALQGGALRLMYLGDWLTKITTMQTASGTASLFSAAGFRAAALGARGFAVALLANPLTWIVLALVAVGAAVYQVVKHWRVLKFEATQLGTTLYNAGKNIVSMLARGILSGAAAPWNAIKTVVEKVRRFLPFSPAKEGPLQDLHRIRLVETIAETIRPAPLANAMRRATATIAVAATAGASGGIGRAGGAPGAIHIEINAPVTITLGGDAQTMLPELDRRLADHRRQLTKHIVDVVNGNARHQY